MKRIPGRQAQRRWWTDVRRVAAVVVAVAGCVPPLVAQGKPLTATGSRALAIGTVFPGVRTTVLRTDATRSGAFDVRGTKNLEVRFNFTLPGAMATPAGQTMPLAFDATSGGWATTATIGAATAFDPRVPLLARLSNTGRLYIWLGGTVVPSSAQAAGAYTATITLTLAYTGN